MNSQMASSEYFDAPVCGACRKVIRAEMSAREQTLTLLSDPAVAALLSDAPHLPQCRSRMNARHGDCICGDLLSYGETVKQACVKAVDLWRGEPTGHGVTFDDGFYSGMEEALRTVRTVDVEGV